MINKIGVLNQSSYNFGYSYPRENVVKSQIKSNQNRSQIHKLSDYCNYSTISFGQKQKQIDLLSKEYSEKCYFPSYKKVPDGFKFMQSKYIFSDDGLDKKGHIAKSLKEIEQQEQITLINRHKDSSYKTIEKAYNKRFSELEKELKNKQNISNVAWNNVLIEKTASFVRSINGLILPERVRNCESNEFIKGKECYLGDIFAEKSDVCRHDAFLFKMLLQDKGINTGIQSGYAFSKDYPTYHTWNTFKTKEGKEVPFDVNADLSEIFLFNNDGKVLYQDSMPKSKLTKLDILSIQYDDSLTLGLDKDGDLISNKRNKDIEPLVTLKTEKSGKISYNIEKELSQKEADIVKNITDKYTFREIYPFLGLKFNAVKKQLFNLPNLNKFSGPKEAIDSLNTDLNETTKIAFANWLTRGM